VSALYKGLNLGRLTEMSIVSALPINDAIVGFGGFAVFVCNKGFVT
jgi:hypothetical protein